MHIKQKPNDFRVEELTKSKAGGGGLFAFYRMEKQGWSTPDALAIIRKRWKLDANRIAVGGLKDRHAATVQYLTIFRGPQRKLTHAHLQVTYLGQVEEAYDSEKIEANRFSVTVRSMTDEQIGTALRTLEEVRKWGVPNYYDDQRFGSVSHGGPFVAKQIMLGDHEAALKNALTAPYAFERSGQKKEKAVLRRHWGDWRLCRQMLPRNRIVEYLFTNPDDFHGALERLPSEIRQLYLSAYQSHLWNRMLSDWIRDYVPFKDLIEVPLRLGAMPMSRRLSSEGVEQARSLTLPLHSARNHLEEGDKRKPYFDRILEEEDLTLDQFKLKGFHAMFFSKGERDAWCFPRDLEARDARDEEHARKRKLTLRFDLPRGCYATLVVKRVTRAGEVDD
jgi:tRNA pseudouridine13 synthase